MDRSLNKWNVEPDPETLNYHKRQYDEPYRSTVAFAEFIRDWVKPDDTILDLGCGAGASTKYLADKFQQAKFEGRDISRKLIRIAKKNANGLASFAVGDMHKLPFNSTIDGVVSLQTLSWLPSYERPLEQICVKIRPRWFAMSSYFYEGDIDCKIIVTEHLRPRVSYHNIYSIPRVSNFVARRNYKLASAKKFVMDRDLPKPQNPNIMQTWTEGIRQFSGPLYLPWWFLLYERA